jgi:hypothetical protein
MAVLLLDSGWYAIILHLNKGRLRLILESEASQDKERCQ